MPVCISQVALLAAALGPFFASGTASPSKCEAGNAPSNNGPGDVLLMQTRTRVTIAAQQAKEERQLSAGRCAFPQAPDAAHYWEPRCKLGMLGCWADGVHMECRFCGQAPYTSIPCPKNARAAGVSICAFTEWPVEKVYFEPSCEEGQLGCLADGKHIGCRFCGGTGVYASIPCPKSVIRNCTFDAPPQTPYFWDPTCAPGTLGCKADGIHHECRFCAARPFESIPCPKRVPHKCVFRNQPVTAYYWEPTCQKGILGCWADGIHAECRFCGGDGAYASIQCP